MKLFLFSASLLVGLSSQSNSSEDPSLFLEGGAVPISAKVAQPLIQKHSLLEPGYSEEKRRKIPLSQATTPQIPDDVRAQLHQRANTLKPLVAQAKASLEPLEKIIAERALASSHAHKIERAAQLGGIRGSITNLVGSANGILRNLNGYAAAGEDLTANMGGAILASGCLKDQLDKLIEYLSSQPDLKDIDPTALKTARDGLSIITATLPNFTLEQYDD